MIYYKLNTYIRKQDALQIAELSREKNLSVWETALSYEGLDGYAKGNIKSVATHMEHLLTEPGIQSNPSDCAVHGLSGLFEKKRDQRHEARYLENAGFIGGDSTSAGGAACMNYRKLIEEKEQDPDLSVYLIYDSCQQGTGI